MQERGKQDETKVMKPKELSIVEIPLRLPKITVTSKRVYEKIGKMFGLKRMFTLTFQLDRNAK